MPNHRSAAPALAAVAPLFLAGCLGVIGGSGDPSSGAGPMHPELHNVAAHVRRLTATEIRNSMRDLFELDDSGFDWSTFPVESKVGQFDNQFATLSVDANFGSTLQSAAEWCAAAAVAKLSSSLSSCDTSADGGAACASSFLDDWGARVYRRPLGSDERATLLSIYGDTRKQEDHATAIATMLEAMLQSPAFLYRTELGNAIGSATPLTPYEVASALSYFFWQSTPDQPLLDAAANGQLVTRDDIAAQAQRMAGDARASLAAVSMFTAWLGLQALPTMSKDSSTGWQEAMAGSMQAEIATFVAQTVWSGAHGFADLFQSSSSFVDANLASIYGIPAPAGSGLVPVALDPQKHAGFLTMPGFIATHTPGRDRGPVRLGLFVRSSLFCQPLPPPPANVPPVPPGPALDEKDRYAQHEKPGCNSCHSQMDPIGFAWSQFDVLGRFQPQDNDIVEDGSGSITNSDVDGSFTGPVELGRKLAASKQVQGCFTRAAARWALGRDIVSDATYSDGAAVKQAASGLDSGDLKSLFVAIATSDAFRFRDTTAVPPGGSRP